MKILTVCPSKGRPQQFKQMIDSFYLTSKGRVDLIVMLDLLDNTLEHYPRWHDDKQSVYDIGKGTVTQRINEAVRLFPDYDIYHITNDDVIYRTLNWDLTITSIIKEHGLAVYYGDDLFQRINHPTFPFIPRQFVESTGWLQLTDLNRYFGDTVWAVLGSNLKRIVYCPEVIIEHLHFLAGKGEESVDMPMFERDKSAFALWLQQAHVVVDKLKGVL